MLRLLRVHVYGHSASPYLPLLEHAGVELGDLAALLRDEGVDGTLAKLRDAGVHLRHDELRGASAIVRGSLQLEPDPSDFDNRLLLGRALPGSTGGTKSAPRRVLMDWNKVAEEAPGNCLFMKAWGLERAPHALWLPPPPGVAALIALLTNARRGAPPERWFSPVPTSMRGAPFPAPIAPYALSAIARLSGARLPRPELVTAEHPEPIAAWLAARPRASLRASASAAVRVAEAARAAGVSLQGRSAVVGGEPLTEDRAAALEAVGLRPVPWYGAAEIGVVGFGCATGEATDDLHLAVDLLAAIGGSDADASRGPAGILFTDMSLAGPKILINASIGDRAVLERRACGCPLGQVGMDLHLHAVRSDHRITAEGMAVQHADLDAAAGRCLAAKGAGPNDYAVWELPEADGTKVALAVEPELELDEQELAEEVFSELRTGVEGGALAAEAWSRAGTLRIIRTALEPNASLKMPRRAPQAPKPD